MILITSRIGFRASAAALWLTAIMLSAGAAGAEVSLTPRVGFLRGDVVSLVEKWKVFVNELKFPIDTTVAGLDELYLLGVQANSSSWRAPA